MAPSNVTTGPAEAALPAVEINISGTKPCLTSEHALNTSAYTLFSNAAAVAASADIITDANTLRKASHAATAVAAASPSSVRRAAPMLTPAATHRSGTHYRNAALQPATSATTSGTTPSAAAAATAPAASAANIPTAATGTSATVSIALAAPRAPSAAATVAPLAAATSALAALSTAFAARAAVCGAPPFSTEASVAAAAPTVVAETDALPEAEVNQREAGALASALITAVAPAIAALATAAPATAAPATAAPATAASTTAAPVTAALATAALATAALPPATEGRNDMSTAAAKEESVQAEAPASTPPSIAPKLLVEELFCGSPFSGLQSPQASTSHQRAASTAASHSGRPESSYVESTTRHCQNTSANAAFSASAASGADQLLVQHATHLLRCFAAALMCVTQPTAAALSAAVEEEAVAGETATKVGAAAHAPEEPAQRPSHVPNLVCFAAPVRHGSWQPCSDRLSANSHFEATSARGAAAHSTDVVSPAALLYLVTPLASQETERSFEQSTRSTEAEAPSPQQQQQRQQHYHESQHQGLSSQQGQQQHQQQELEKQQQQQRQERLLRRAVAAAVELRRVLLLLCAALPRKPVVRGLNQEEETGCALSVGGADAEGEIGIPFNSPYVCSCTPPQLLQPPRHCMQHHWAPQHELEKELLVYLQERRQRQERRKHQTTAADSPDSSTKDKCEGQETCLCSQSRRLSLKHLRQQQLQQQQLRQKQLRQRQLRQPQQQLKTQIAEDGREEEAMCSRERSLRKHSMRRGSDSSMSRSSSSISIEHGTPSAAGECISECARRPVMRSMTPHTRPKRWFSPAVLPADAATGVAEGEAAAGHTERQRERAGSEPARGRRRRAQEDSATRTSKLVELRLCRSRLLRRFQRQRFQQQTLLQQLGRIFLFCSTVRSSPTLFSAYLLLLLCTPGNAGDMLLLSLAGFWKVCDDAEAAAATADAAVCAAAADAVTTPASHSTRLVKSISSPFGSRATAATAPAAAASCKPAAVARGGRQPGFDSAPVEEEEEKEEGEYSMETERQKQPHCRDRKLTAGAAHAAGDVFAGSPRACCCCRWHLLRRLHCVEYVRCFVAELLPLLLWMYTSRCLLPPHKLCIMHSSLLVLPHIDVAAAASAAVSSAAAVTAGTPRDTAAAAAPALGARPLASPAQQCAALAKGVCDYLQGVIEDPIFVEEAPDSYIGLENLLLLLAGERCSLLAVAGVAAAGLAAAATGSTTSSASDGESGQAAVEAIVASVQQLTHEQELDLALRAAEMASFAGEAIVSAGAAAAAAPPHTLVAAAASDVNSSACRRLQELLDATFAGPSYVSKGVSELRRADSAAVARTIAAQHADAEILLRMLRGGSNCIHPGGLHSITDMTTQARSPIFCAEQSEASAERSESRRAVVNENFLGRRIAAAGRKKGGTGGKSWGRMLCGESLLIRRSAGFPLTHMTAQQQQQLTLHCLCTYSFYAGVCAALEKHVAEQCVAGGTAAMACCCGNVSTLINGGYYYVRDCKTNTGHSNTDTCCCSKGSGRHSDVWPPHTHSNRSIAVSREKSPYTSNSAGCMTPPWDRRSTRRRRDGRESRRRSCVVAPSTVRSGVSALPVQEAKEHACSVAAAGAGWQPGVVAAAFAAAAERGEEQALLLPQEHLEMLTAWYLAAVTNPKALTPVSLRHVLPQPLISAMLQQDGEQQRLKKCSKHLGVSHVMNTVCACKACSDTREIVAAATTTSGCRQPLGSTGVSRPDAAAAQGVKSLQDVRAIVVAALSAKTPTAGGQQKMHSLYTLEQLLSMSVDPWGAGSRPPPAAVSEGLLLQAASTVGRLLFLRQRICITPCLLDSEGDGGSGTRRSSNSMVSNSSSSGFFGNPSNHFKDAGLLTVLADVQGRQLERMGLIWRRLAQEQLQRQQHRLHMQQIREAQLRMWQGNHKQHHQQQVASLEKESSVSMPQQHTFWTVADSHARKQLDSHCKDHVQQRRQQNCIGAKCRVLPELSESSTPRFQSALSLVQPQHAVQQPNMLLPPEAAPLLYQSTHAPQRYRVILPQQQVLRLLLWHQMEHFDCSCELATSANGLSCSFLTGLTACCCVDGLDACTHLCGEEWIRLPLSVQEVPMQRHEKALGQQQQWCACGTSTCSGTHTVEALSQGAAAAAQVWGDAWLRQRLVRHELERALAAIEKRAARDMLLKSYWAAAAIRSVLH